MRAALALAVIAGCGHGGGRVATEWIKPRPRCPAPAAAPTAWRHTSSRFIGSMEPRHAANDDVVAAGAPIEIMGKLAYGPTSKDLQDETVALWMEDGACKAAQLATAATDADGRVRFKLAARAAGTYQFWLVVAGDGSVAPGTVWVVPPGQPAVVFDVDGTLTTSDGELAQQLVDGKSPDMYPDADGVARYWAERGNLVVYLTGRPYFLAASTHRWLDGNHFPAGPMITTDRLRDAIPGAGHVGEWKTEVMRRLLATKLDVVRAYGNADTDVCAYARSGVAPGHTFIVGPDARRCDDQPPTLPLNSYTDHLRELGSSQEAR